MATVDWVAWLADLAGPTPSVWRLLWDAVRGRPI